MKMFRKAEGFTLVELMVVVLIIGILVAIAVPVFNSAKAAAQRKSCWANQRTVEGAYQTYKADLDEAGTFSAPANWAALMTVLAGGNYIKSEPVCNAGGNYNSTVISTQTVTVVCSVTSHTTHP